MSTAPTTARPTPRGAALHGHPHVRALPARDDWANADVAVLGVPFDTATSYRTGPRFGPAAIRDQSQLIRPWHPALEVDVFAALSVSTAATSPSRPATRSARPAQIADGPRPVIEAGAIPIVLGGDHSIVLGELRAHAAVHGPLGVVLLDAHADTWDSTTASATSTARRSGARSRRG